MGTDKQKPALQKLEEADGKILWIYDNGEVKEFEIKQDEKGRFISDVVNNIISSDPESVNRYLLTANNIETKLEQKDFDFKYCIF